MLIELAAGDLCAGVVDNEAHPELDGHGAGYNGLAWLKHAARPVNLFVPAYAGMNLELYVDGVEGEGSKLFEPRRAPMSVRQVDQSAAELHQPPTPFWQVESWTRFRLTAPHYVDFHYRAVPRAATFGSGWMGVFWASYIDRPEDLAISFPAADEAGGEKWIRHYSPVHGLESTHRRKGDQFEITAPENASTFMYASYSPWRYARPFYLGVSHGMMYLFMSEDSPKVRFTQSPSGGGAGCPAWDYQLIVPAVVVGEAYSLRARVAYKPYANRLDVEDEYRRWQAILCESE